MHGTILKKLQLHTHTHTHTHIYIYIWIEITLSLSLSLSYFFILISFRYTHEFTLSFFIFLVYWFFDDLFILDPSSFTPHLEKKKFKNLNRIRGAKFDNKEIQFKT